MADCYCEMDEAATGVYVSVDDYEHLRARLAEAEAAAKTWENEAERRSRRYEKCAVALAEAERRKLQLIATLQSIASNSCCDNCREAALVAQSAIDAAIDAAMGESRE